MLQKNAISEISPDTSVFYSNVFLVRKASGGWRPVIDLKQLNHHINAPHFHMHTISSVLSTVERGDFAFKIDLQDAYFHVLIHPHSRKYLCFAFENKVYQFRVLQSEHCPSGTYSPGTNSDSLPPRDIGNSISKRLVDTLPRPPSVTSPPVQDIQFLGLPLLLDQGRVSLPESKAQGDRAHARLISSQKTLSYTEVCHFMGSLNWASCLIPLCRLHLRPLQRHFHSLGLTNWFSTPRLSDPVVLATLLRQWQDLSFLTSGIPI